LGLEELRQEKSKDQKSLKVFAAANHQYIIIIQQEYIITSNINGEAKAERYSACPKQSCQQHVFK